MKTAAKKTKKDVLSRPFWFFLTTNIDSPVPKRKWLGKRQKKKHGNHLQISFRLSIGYTLVHFI